MKTFSPLGDKLPFDGSLPFVLCTAGSEAKQAPVNRYQGATWNQIIWVSSGGGSFRVGDTEFTLETGEGAFMRHSVPHFYSGDELSTSYITFFCTDSFINYFMGDKICCKFKAPDFLERELDELCRFACGGAEKAAISAMGYSFVTEIFLSIEKESDSIVERIRSYLNEHISEPISLDDAAASVGLDRFALCRYFRQNHSCSVMTELKNMRISKAKQLLKYSSEPVERISMLCGFESASYFTLRFREQCGCTPTEYRKRRR